MIFFLLCKVSQALFFKYGNLQRRSQSIIKSQDPPMHVFTIEPNNVLMYAYLRNLHSILFVVCSMVLLLVINFHPSNILVWTQRITFTSCGWIIYKLLIISPYHFWNSSPRHENFPQYNIEQTNVNKYRGYLLRLK